jgi:hypothetical protein
MPGIPEFTLEDEDKLAPQLGDPRHAFAAHLEIESDQDPTKVQLLFRTSSGRKPPMIQTYQIIPLREGKKLKWIFDFQIDPDDCAPTETYYVRGVFTFPGAK